MTTPQVEAGPTERFIEALRAHGIKRLRQNGRGWECLCPNHDDRVPSLSIGVGRGGKVLLRCFAGCKVEAIVAAVGLELRDLFPERPSANGSRRIVATYDYVDETGKLLFQVVRYEPKNFRQRRPDGHGGWIWKLGNTRRVLYRLPQLREAIEAGTTPVYVVEGERDVERVEQAGAVATCNAMGAGKWRDEYAKQLAGAESVVVVADDDEPGRRHALEVARSLRAAGIATTTALPATGRDVSDHLAAGRGLGELVPLEENEPPPTRSDTIGHPTNSRDPAPQAGSGCRTADPTTVRQRPDLALADNILDAFGADLRRLGVAGEERIAKITYLALTSRLLPWGKASNRPVSIITKGTSSSGKSHVTAAVIEFMPEETVVTLSSSSRLYLLYSDRPLQHRFVYVPEWAAIAEQDELVTLLRLLVSEGRIEHGTVEGAGRKEARELRKDGPTGLLMTSTAALTDTELETRCLALRTDDSPEQTRRIFAAIAELEAAGGGSVDLAPWHDLQLWLETQDNRVVIPYVDALAQLMPTSATRLRRDFVSMLCLVRAHAILHQATRDRGGDGRIVATLDDYEAVRLLVGELVAEGADAFVPHAIRETVEAVRAIIEDGAEHATPKAVEERLGIGRGATYDRIARALLVGYIVNVASEGERGKRLRPGQPLPDEPEFLPSSADVEALVGPLSDPPSDIGNGSTIRFTDTLSDVRSCRTDTGGAAVNTPEPAPVIPAEPPASTARGAGDEPTETASRRDLGDALERLLPMGPEAAPAPEPSEAELDEADERYERARRASS